MAFKKYEGGDEELDRLLKAQGDRYASAKQAGDVDGMRAANDAANQLRNKYDYAAEYADKDIGYVKGLTGYQGGGGPGSSRPTGGGYSAPSAPTYSSKYGDQIDELLDQILGREKFSYDAESDPTYQQYKDSYTRQGQRAMTDTLGQVSARTGGLASSYATTASQQSYNNYMDALSDKIPELEQLARQMYLQEGDQMRGDLSLLMGMDQADYGKYQDALGQYNADRSFGYGVSRDQLGDARYDREWRYQAGRDALDDQRYQQEYADQRGDVAYGREADQAAVLASTGDFSGYAKLFGLSEEQTRGLVDSYAKQEKKTEEQAARDLADWYARYGDFSKLRGLGVESPYTSALQATGRVARQDARGAEIGEDFIQDVSGLGPKALALANQMSRVGSTQHPGHFAEAIEKGLGDGSITEAEADLLLRALGY